MQSRGVPEEARAGRLHAQNQHGDHMSEPSAAPVAAPASMPMASGAPEL